ncbi:FABR172Wp [Eremothecium gossypii FDAG1]|nr:FABR172Wp [Eremothecium gossypii FDAG1]
MVEDDSAPAMELTFAHETRLRKLPLPGLRSTASLLTATLEPFHSGGTHDGGGADVELASYLGSLADSSGALKLQAKLEEFDKHSACYLDRLHLNIHNHVAGKEISQDILPRNPFLVLAEDAEIDISQEDRAGVLCYSALRFVSALRRQQLPPDHSRGQALSMKPYLNLFGTTRCPIFEPGEVESFDLNKPYSESDVEAETRSDLMEPATKVTSPDDRPRSEGSDEPFNHHGISMKQYPASKHILILSKGQYYTLDVLDDDHRILYTDKDMAKVFASVLEDSRKSYSVDRSTALGSLTSYSFRNWKYARKRLQKRFPVELEMIDSALFVIVMDESDRSDEDQSYAKRLFYGTSVIDEVTGLQVGSCTTRWYDKLQLVVTADAKACIIWDSFTCEGSAVLRFTSEVYAESVMRLARDVNENSSAFSLWPSIETRRILDVGDNADKFLRKIEWSFLNEMNTHIHLSETKLSDIISKHDIINYTLPFGRHIARRLNIRPDSMIQVGLQIAHYALYGKIIFALEPVSVRSFQNSMSAFIPIQSTKLAELCRQFISNSLDTSLKYMQFIEACHAHSELIEQAKQGHAAEKHFNALRHLFKFRRHFGIDLDVDEIEQLSGLFDSPQLVPFFTPEMIASNCGNAAMTMFGVTPAMRQGFGIGYILKNEQCDLTVISQYRQGKRLMFMLEWVLTEICEYWKSTRKHSEDIKISPTVDLLYGIDNALKSEKVERSERRPSAFYNGGYGLFDLKGHVESRSSVCSTPVSRSGSHLKLTELITSLSFNNVNALTTEEDKQVTGYEIAKIDQPKSSSPDTDELATDDKPSRKSNVINSKFVINFDRSSVGRKVNTSD